MISIDGINLGTERILYVLNNTYDNGMDEGLGKTRFGLTNLYQGKQEKIETKRNSSQS